MRPLLKIVAASLALLPVRLELSPPPATCLSKVRSYGLKQNDLCDYRLIFIVHLSFSVSEDIESREDFSTVSEHIEMSAHERQ